MQLALFSMMIALVKNLYNKKLIKFSFYVKIETERESGGKYDEGTLCKWDFLYFSFSICFALLPFAVHHFENCPHSQDFACMYGDPYQFSLSLSLYTYKQIDANVYVYILKLHTDESTMHAMSLRARTCYQKRWMDGIFQLGVQTGFTSRV